MSITPESGQEAYNKSQELEQGFVGIANEQSVIAEKIGRVQLMLNGIVEDLPLINFKIVTQKALEDILQRLKDLKDVIDQLWGELDDLDKKQSALEKEADAFMRQLRSDQLGDCENALCGAGDDIKELEQKLEELFDIIGGFNEDLTVAKRTADEDKE